MNTNKQYEGGEKKYHDPAYINEERVDNSGTSQQPATIPEPRQNSSNNSNNDSNKK